MKVINLCRYGLLVFLTPSLALADGKVLMYFREKDGATQHLYKASCLEGKQPVCSLKTIAIRPACLVTYQNLFENEVAQSPQKGTFSVTVSRGRCGYTNTYVLSSQGLVLTRASPPSVPEGCKTFPPQIYRAEVYPEDMAMLDSVTFMKVPLGNCKEINVQIFD